MLDEKDMLFMKELLEDQKSDILKETMHNVQVILENTVGKQLQLLVEGQQTILQTLAPKDRVEALEDEIVFLKQVIRAMSKDIAELKKAQ